MAAFAIEIALSGAPHVFKPSNEPPAVAVEIWEGSKLVGQVDHETS
jgi:hypothetical protein